MLSDKLNGKRIHFKFCREPFSSWETILKKEVHFRAAYSGFDIQKVASFTETDRLRLLADPGIIRNKLKINAAIENAKVILTLQEKFGSFEIWLEQNHSKTNISFFPLLPVL